MSRSMRKLDGISRREFLASGVGAAGSLAFGVSCTLSGTPFEGIYTDRFTYRQGEWILVSAALQASATVQVELRREDAPGVGHIGLYPMVVTDRGNPERPGEMGANFPFAAAIDTEGLEPGIYSLELAPELLQPQNRANHYHHFPSLNTIARFVVTPRIPGSRSPILWIHDSLTGVCYGSYGGQSIYGSAGVQSRTVSYARPGLERATVEWGPVRFWRDHGYDFEFIDLVELSRVAPGYLAPYQLVIVSGQFEYVPQEVMEQLSGFVAAGGNLLVASHEFGIFRVRLDHEKQQLTTYKWDFEVADPLAGIGDPRVAGVAMNCPEVIYETELVGQHLWAAHSVSAVDWVDMPLYNLAEAGWILDGTGLGSGDSLPGAFRFFGLGQRLRFDGNGKPVLVDPEFTRTFEDTLVWAAVPSPDGRAWWEAAGRYVADWPLLSDGYATCSLQERPSGARIVTFPSKHLASAHLSDPLYQKILLNVIERLS